MEKPILFNTQMVQAILDGRKTQTRRVIKPQPIWVGEPNTPFKTRDADPKGIIDCPYEKGDILWVREAFCPRYFDDSSPAYKADYDKNRIGDVVPEPKWRPSIHMPKSAARIFLKVTDVRVERVQDITPADCIAEGIINPTCEKCLSLIGECKPQSDVDVFCGNDEQLIDRYADLWNSLNAKRGYDWETNPWVWVITFEKIEGGINNE